MTPSSILRVGYCQSGRPRNSGYYSVLFSTAASCAHRTTPVPTQQQSTNVCGTAELAVWPVSDIMITDQATVFVVSCSVPHLSVGSCNAWPPCIHFRCSWVYLLVQLGDVLKSEYLDCKGQVSPTVVSRAHILLLELGSCVCVACWQRCCTDDVTGHMPDQGTSFP